VAHPNGRVPKTLLRETTKAWVDAIGAPAFLKDGSFVWTSDRSGWRHAYLYKNDGTLVRPITSGQWDMKTLHGVDEAAGWLYFSGTERSYIGSDVYRIKLDGTGLSRLSQTAGSHRASFSPGFAHYVDTWSDLHTPPQVRIHKSDGAEVRVVHESKIAELAQIKMSKPELLQVKARDGFVMDAILIRPTDFNPSRKYPVMQFTYGGPSAPQVRNGWYGASMMYYQLLAQRGIAVWIMDNRSASGKGAQSTWAAYKQLGVSELADIEDGLAWLKKESWVEGARVGIDGWSYGGFMTTYALTHSTSFAMGIGGGNVTDWSLYDSIYTERYMLMPQNNPEGYEKTSVLKAAKNLHGQLLLIHGVIDDNVHMQNTMALAYELQKAGKQFRLMTYERSRHGITDPDLNKHLRQMMLDFTLEILLKPVAPATSTAAK
jgi:dipeptidyl-peptidase-4